ncbi:MAG: LLM class flavin-dependent oxidoreductase [Rhodospirillales bacterium]|nr:LLM class flavin-dependent oxidoreductase [Rhodospirillales bacterium]
MKFGFMEDFRNPVKWRRPFPEFYQAILEQIAHGEDLGYDNVWLTEHHFTEDGYNPSIMPTAAAVAARTSRIRIGSFILLAPPTSDQNCRGYGLRGYFIQRAF